MSRSRSAAAAKIAEAAPVFAALGDATRLRLVARLCGDGPLSIARLSDGTGVTRQAITKHLNALAAAGLARDTRSGRERIWELEPSPPRKRPPLPRPNRRPVGRRDRSIEDVRRGRNLSRRLGAGAGG